MGAIHACLCVSECKFENGSCALSWISPALAGQRPGTDSQKFHGDISEAVSEQSVWLSTLIKQHSVVVWITLLNNAGVIPGNRPVESWITPALIVLPSNLAGVALRRALREQNMKPERSVFSLVEFGVAAHVFSKPVSKTLNNCLDCARLDDKGKLWVLCGWLHNLVTIVKHACAHGHTEARTLVSVYRRTSLVPS